MTEADVPEADAREQAQDARRPAPEATMGGSAPEVPEADALEQAQDVDDPTVLGRPVPGIGVEVPEADALEQAQEVPLDEDEMRS